VCAPHTDKIMNNQLITPSANQNKIRLRRQLETFTDDHIDRIIIDPASVLSAEISPTRRRYMSAMFGRYVRQCIINVKSLSGVGNGDAVRAIIHRLESLSVSFAPQQNSGSKIGKWISDESLARQHGMIDRSADRGLRDSIIIHLLGRCGLRREEASSLEYSDIVAAGGRYRLNIKGKGRKNRNVPISSAAVREINLMKNQHGGTRVLKKIDRYGNVHDGMSGHSINAIVSRLIYDDANNPLSAHDLRRTAARVLYDKDVDILAISKWLGHASTATTEKYLGLQTAVIDNLEIFQ